MSPRISLSLGQYIENALLTNLNEALTLVESISGSVSDVTTIRSRVGRGLPGEVIHPVSKESKARVSGYRNTSHPAMSGQQLSKCTDTS